MFESRPFSDVVILNPPLYSQCHLPFGPGSRGWPGRYGYDSMSVPNTKRTLAKRR
jgi:hypothetical protein